MKRTKNAVRNIISGFMYRIVMLIFPFIIRTVMIKTLGSEYLGLNSLFTSILQVLNLAELGFSSAVVYSMYKPIVEKDKKKICALMNLYKKIYRCIGIIITIIGLIILPFLKYFINGSYPENINIYILYFIYLVNTSFTYFLFAYKNSLLIAHQRSDISNNVYIFSSIIQYTLQIISLTLFKNYYYFVEVQILTTIINNLVVYIITKKLYPDYECYGEVDYKTKNEIKKNVMGLLIQRICSTTRNSFDSIFISAFLGLNFVAIYSNYYSIISALIGVMGILTSSIIAGIGNSIVTEGEKKNYNDMNKFNFMYMWISGWCTICMICLFQPFMKLWMGEEYLLSYPIVILLCIYFYSLKMGDIRAAYSDAKGLWYENRYRAIVESLMNVILNFILVKKLGIYGIILGTLVSLLIINFGYGSQILFKNYFKDEKISDYFKRHLLYAFVTFIIALITYFICSKVNVTGVQEIILKSIICLFIPNILYYIFYFKTKIFNESKKILNNIFKLRK